MVLKLQFRTVLGKQFLAEIGELQQLFAQRAVEVERTDGGLVISFAGLTISAGQMLSMPMIALGAVLLLIAYRHTKS